MKPLIFKGETFSERSRRNLLILEAIRRLGPITKADISRIAGVNVVTISNYIDYYLKTKLVSTRELDVSSGGRRPTLLELNADTVLSIGLGLNLVDMVGVLVNLKGDMIGRASRVRPQASQAFEINDIIDSAESIIRELLGKIPPSDKEKIRGIGIGIAGVRDNENNNLRWPEKIPDGSCRYVSLYLPLKDIIEKKFGLPCILENDATVACFGEQWMNRESLAENLIYMFSGVGSGLILNGEVYRGATGNAGEVSLNFDKVVKNEFLNSKMSDSYFLRPWEDDLGIIRNTRKALEKWANRNSHILALVEGKPENITLPIIFEAVQQKDRLALEITREAGCWLGIKIAFLVNLLNPQMVVIGGGMEEAGSEFLEAVKETVSDLAFAETANAVKIVPSKLGRNAISLGAASLIIRKTFADI